MSQPPLHNELKKEFQLERLILFSDAVFAIAITLLVIEIKIPEVENPSDAAILHALGHLIPKFIGYIISFMLIGTYWLVHHRLFGFVTSYDRKLLVLNLFLLFFIALMPFSTGFYGDYTSGDFVKNQIKVPMTFYVLNFCSAGIVNYFMWRHVINPKNKLAQPPIDPLTAKISKSRALVVPIIFLSMIPVAYLTNVILAVYIPVFIPFAMKMLKKRIEKRYLKHHKH